MLNDAPSITLHHAKLRTEYQRKLLQHEQVIKRLPKN